MAIVLDYIQPKVRNRKSYTEIPLIVSGIGKQTESAGAIGGKSPIETPSLPFSLRV